MKKFAIFLMLLGVTVGCLAIMPFDRWPLRGMPHLDPSALREAKSWGYQLQRARADRLKSDIDVLVIDYARDGRAATAFSREQVAEFRTRVVDSAGAAAASSPAARRRLVLAYMSIGEAEIYRYYWSPLWSVQKPAWMGEENKDWKGNYLVKFWDKAWQRTIVQARPSVLDRIAETQFAWRKPYIDRILEAGFDGVYLDRVDAFENLKTERPTAERDMVDFVKTISAYAKARRPGFLIVPQNAEELLAHADYRAVIDGVAKEDLLYGLAGDAKPNTEDDVKESISFLARARGDRLPVFVVEYLRDTDQRFEADMKLRAQGFVPLFSSRQLNQPPETQVPAPVAVPVETPSPVAR